MSGRRKRRSRKVKVTYADGRVEYLKPSVFKPPSRRKQWRNEYERYLSSLDWRLLRTKVLLRDDHRCTSCGAKGRLQVHHLTYERLGHEDMGDLTTLCDKCHLAVHRLP